MKSKPETPKEVPKGKVRFCACFKETFAKHQDVQAKLNEFMQLKIADPMARFGTTDEHFRGGGSLKDTGVLHAHLTSDISVLYKRHGKAPTLIDLYAVLSHDELGTGQPRDIKQQRNVAKVISGQTFEAKR
jgi:hypothetical protein